MEVTSATRDFTPKSPCSADIPDKGHLEQKVNCFLKQDTVHLKSRSSLSSEQDNFCIELNF